MTEPPGKSVFFNDRLGLLFVKATKSDLDTIERALSALNQVAPQIHIKARFLKVPKKTLDAFEKDFNLTNAADGKLTGILTSGNGRLAIRMLQRRPDVERLGEPEVTTISGRQTQMRVTTTSKEDIVFDVGVSKTLETGPVLDVVPYVLSDGYTINLTLIPSLTELLDSSNSDPKILPVVRIRQVVTTVNLWDDQTVVLGNLPGKDYIGAKEAVEITKTSDKELLVFITATIVDPAGNRIHSADELPFAQKGIPKQPAPPPK